MAGILKDELKNDNNEIKEEIQEEILPSSIVEDTCTVEDSFTVEDSCTVEDTCTVYIKEDDVKVEIAENQGKIC